MQLTKYNVKSKFQEWSRNLPNPAEAIIAGVGFTQGLSLELSRKTDTQDGEFAASKRRLIHDPRYDTPMFIDVRCRSSDAAPAPRRRRIHRTRCESITENITEPNT